MPHSWRVSRRRWKPSRGALKRRWDRAVDSAHLAHLAHSAHTAHAADAALATHTPEPPFARKLVLSCALAAMYAARHSKLSVSRRPAAPLGSRGLSTARDCHPLRLLSGCSRHCVHLPIGLLQCRLQHAVYRFGRALP